MNKKALLLVNNFLCNYIIFVDVSDFDEQQGGAILSIGVTVPRRKGFASYGEGMHQTISRALV